jgi:anti-sigma factor RsiW
MKKQCIDYTILLKYIEKRASDKERDMVESHSADCDHCLSVFARMNRMQKDLQFIYNFIIK